MQTLVQQDLNNPERGPVVTRAVLRSAERLGLSARLLGAVIGLSEPTISRMKRGEYVLEDKTKSFELSVLLVRVFRSLDAITGGNDAVAKAWIKNANTALGGKPADKLVSISGLVDVIAYLDARRALV